MSSCHVDLEWPNLSRRWPGMPRAEAIGRHGVLGALQKPRVVLAQAPPDLHEAEAMTARPSLEAFGSRRLEGQEARASISRMKAWSRIILTFGSFMSSWPSSFKDPKHKSRLSMNSSQEKLAL